LPFNELSTPLLVTERLLLRRSLSEDAEAISGYGSDPDVLG